MKDNQINPMSSTKALKVLKGKW